MEVRVTSDLRNLYNQFMQSQAQVYTNNTITSSQIKYVNKKHVRRMQYNLICHCDRLGLQEVPI